MKFIPWKKKQQEEEVSVAVRVDRFDRYRKPCPRCGRLMNGKGGYKRQPKTCRQCSEELQRASKYWTRDRILASIQEWDSIHGRPPKSREWLGKVEDSPGRDWKSRSGPHRRWPTVHSVQSEFGSWANAIEAAGFPRPKVGCYERTRMSIDQRHEKRIAEMMSFYERYPETLMMIGSKGLDSSQKKS